MATRFVLALACLCVAGIGARPGGEVALLQPSSLFQLTDSDEVALLQRGLDIHGRRRESLLLGPAGDLAFNCTRYPDFCRAPFNCQDWVPPARPQNVVFPALPGLGAKDGHSNFQTWCGSPQYYDYMTTCIQKKDLRKAGRIQYQWTVGEADHYYGNYPGDISVADLDASYCFLEGHCTNAAVTEDTTVEEAEKMCDLRYGHNGWANMTASDFETALRIRPEYMNSTFGFHDESVTKDFLKIACVMGNFHCDVMYCKEAFCQKEYFVKKYKHLEPTTPGHLIRQL